MPTPKQIHDARKRLGMTQRQLAKALGMSRRGIQNWEAAPRTLNHRKAPAFLSLALKFLELHKQE
jgi:DNA-binding transcriptional regulator YiaG